MQFLSSSLGNLNDLSGFEAAGLLHGVYRRAFDAFLDLSELDPPKSVLDMKVALFLLICDLAINPVEGFPCDIYDFENFVHVNDPGIRFDLLCRSVANQPAGFEKRLSDYSRDAYMEVSMLLMADVELTHPVNGWERVKSWVASSERVRVLINEKSKLRYQHRNIVYRVLLSHFISFNLDKLKSPELFCWPGYWKANAGSNAEIEEMWLRNLSLFSDKPDDDGIFIRQFPGIEDDALTETLNLFFGNNVLFDLSRQWMLQDSDFSFDFSWLSKHDEAEWRAWAERMFEKQYGVAISSIVPVQAK